MIRFHSVSFINGISLGAEVVFNADLDEIDHETLEFEDDEKHCSVVNIDLLLIRLMFLIG
jgi:hypothetical protein